MKAYQVKFYFVQLAATPPTSSCGAGEFRCGNTETCINDTKVCDKNPDCPNGEEEKDCGKLTPS